MPQVGAIHIHRHLCNFCDYVCMPLEARGQQQVSSSTPLYLNF